MGEIRDLIGIYGAIDRATMEESERRARVSQLLPVYQHPDVHWFDDFEEWTNAKREDTEEPPFPSFEDALRGLAGVEPRGRMRARRLFAIATAAHAFPELLESHGESTALAAALRVGSLAEDDERAQNLLELLGDEQLLLESDDLDAWWQSVLAVASYNGLIADTAGMGPRPCSGRLVMVDLPGGKGPVATLRTEFETSEIDFDHAGRFLEPVNWPDCSDFWCEMTKLGEQPPGVHQYHEVVSTDCPSKESAWTIEAELDFSFTRFTDTAITEYRLRDGHPLPNDDVLVDEGSLVVRQIGSVAKPRLRVTTTKRIMFNHPFSGEALAMIMCALGYASVVEDLVFSCATSGAAGAGTSFPGESPAAGPTKGGPPDLGPVIEAVKECIDDWADAAEASSKKMAEGRYTADALVQDMARAWVRIVRDGATALDVSVRSARMPAGTRAREPSAK